MLDVSSIDIVATWSRLLPQKKTVWSLWYDVYSKEVVTVLPWELKVIGLWIKTKIWLFLYARSSLAVKKWLLFVGWVGVIDTDYRWEIKIPVKNSCKFVKGYVSVIKFLFCKT